MRIGGMSVTQMWVDEASDIPAKTPRIIVGAGQVPCARCGAEPGDPCMNYRFNKPPKEHRAFHHSRVRDAQRAQETAQILMDN